MSVVLKSVVVGVVIVSLLSVVIVTQVDADEFQQERITSTPLPISLASSTPFSTIPAEATATTAWTPTPSGMALLEAIEEANVRADASVDAELLGQIRPGQTYTVLGRYFEWYQFQYDPLLNNGRGWVFGQLVNVTGDTAAIPDLAAQVVPTSLPGVSGVSGLAVEAGADVNPTATPENELTATAQARILSVPDDANLSGVNAVVPPGSALAGVEGTEETLSSMPALPTFTYPPNLVAAAPTASAGSLETNPTPETLPISVSDGVPPLIPIIALGFAGVLGLLASSIRR